MSHARMYGSQIRCNFFFYFPAHFMPTSVEATSISRSEFKLIEFIDTICVSNSLFELVNGVHSSLVSSLSRVFRRFRLEFSLFLLSDWLFVSSWCAPIDVDAKDEVDEYSENSEESDEDDAESESSNFEFCVSAKAAAAAKSLESKYDVVLFDSANSVAFVSSGNVSKRPFSFLQNNSCCLWTNSSRLLWGSMG